MDELIGFYRHHPDCYLTTDSNAAAVAVAVGDNKLEGFPTLKVSFLINFCF